MNVPICGIYCNANGLKDERKRRMVNENCLRERVEVLGLSGTHLSAEREINVVWGGGGLVASMWGHTSSES